MSSVFSRVMADNLANYGEPRGALIHSFDVFDTCITRTFAHPRDLFFELGARLAPAQATPKTRARIARSFQIARIRAEKAATRAVRPFESPTISEIYQYFRKPRETSGSIAEIIAAEVALERESVFAVPEVLDQLAEIRRRGERIIFMSDMYLPSDVLEPILRETGVMQDGDRLFVSCETRLSKHSGRMFHHMLEEEKVAPDQVTHRGDNLWSDVQAPARLGIAAHHVANAVLTAREVDLVGARISKSNEASVIAAFSRRLRLHVRGGALPIEHLVCGTILPFLVAYVSWVLREASATGIERLYFVARDGQILLRIAERLLNQNSGIELRYLFGSRRAWLAPSITRDSEDWTRLIITPTQRCTREDIIARAGLTPETAQRVRGLLGLPEDNWTTPLSHREALDFVSSLTLNKQTASILFDNAETARTIALQYFDQEGLFEGKRWALVDVGWSLNCQAALKRIVATNLGASFKPLGFYIGIARSHEPTAAAGDFRSFIPGTGSLLSRRRVMVEHCFTPATHASTRSYRLRDGVAEPVFGEELRGEAELAYARHLHGAAAIAAEIVRTDARLHGFFSSGPLLPIRNAEQSIQRPTRAEAAFLSSFGTAADLRQERSFIRALCEPLSVGDLYDMLASVVSKRRRFSTPAAMWLEGSAQLSSWFVRMPLSVILAVDSFANRVRRIRIERARRR